MKQRVGIQGVVRFVALALLFATVDVKANYISGVVDRVLDGDTVWLKGGTWQGLAPEGWGVDEFEHWAGSSSSDLKIRMLGMDAPELHLVTDNHGLVGQNPWGDNALKYLLSLVKPGQTVSIQSFGIDKYGRTLGYVFRNNQNLNLAMAQSGWGVPYPICADPGCNSRFLANHHVAEFSAACQSARADGRGVFNRANPLRELPYEFRLRMNNRAPDKFVGDLKTKKLYKPKDYNKVDVCNRVFFYKADEAASAGFH